MKKSIFIFICLFVLSSTFAQSLSAQSSSKELSSKGWEVNAEVGGNMNILGKKSTEWSGNVLVGGGYNWNHNIYLGLETGSILNIGPFMVEHGDRATTNIIPLMADFRYSFKSFNKSWTPYLELRSGYGFTTNSNFNGYGIFNTLAGMRYSIGKHLDLHTTIGYRGMWGKRSDKLMYSDANNLNGINAQLGLGYNF